ncbi:Pancreatic triacylglycerol lipase-like 4 [Homarus americanus]|uniref:Pancreatic triacylglycerol lipase-like 4 n=2 Tax=Homarus americanus TaxID=6706 RepID=A0A8J5MKB8_HOMAM|nr:Pancreatic triacylglycerol lipase-like 4 [Homarus americanus]
MTALTDGLSLYEGLDAAQKELVACNHFRAPKLFTDSILSPCPYTAFQCPSYKHYVNGKCVSCGEDGRGCARLGLHADKWPGSNQNKSLVSLYLTTTAGPHYCLYHYLLKLDLADPGGVVGNLRGNLKVSFFADDGSLRDFNLTPERARTFARGRSYVFFIGHHENLSSAREALVQWTYEADMFNPLSYCVLFCDTSLRLAKLTFTSVDHVDNGGANEIERESSETTEESREVVMCHQQGLDMVRIKSEATVKVVSSASCFNVTRANITRAAATKQNNHTLDLLNAGLASLSSLFKDMNLIAR